MKIVIVGASGFIGTELTQMFDTHGYEVVPVSRKHFKMNIHDFKELFRETDVLINLAGAPIIKRWTTSYKNKIRQSRTDTAQKIHTAFKLLKDRPRLYIAASAIGVYESSPDLHTENSTQFSNGFLGKLVKDWESGSQQFAGLHDVRLVIMRLGIVLSKHGGAYPKLALPYKMLIGGRLGNGKQAMSFIHIDDLKNAVMYFIRNGNAQGVYNLTVPNPVSNRDFSAALGKGLKRPDLLVIPKFLVRWRYGQASSVILDAPWVVSEKLQKNGFSFTYADIKSAIGQLTSKRK